MTQEHTPNTTSNQSISFLVPTLVGGGIALSVILVFILGVDQPNPEWGTFWRIRPLIITPLAGATGGAFYAFMKHLTQRGLNKIIAYILSFIVYVIGLWMGIVLGLAGTMWH